MVTAASLKQFSTKGCGTMGGTSLLPALAMIAMATLATAAEDSGHAIFTKDKVPLKPHLVLQTAARSEVDCVSLCTSAPACHRAVFSQVTGTCQGHGWTADWCAVGLTSVWVKESSARPNPNLAYLKPAQMDSVQAEQRPELAVDGTVDDDCALSDYDYPDSHWWQVDLLDTHRVISVTVDNSVADGSMWDVSIHIYPDPATHPNSTASLCYEQTGRHNPYTVFPCLPTTAPGRWVRITTLAQIEMCEVAVAGCPVQA